MKISAPISIQPLAIIFAALLLAACAKPYHLNVMYAVPEKRVDLPNVVITVSVADARQDEALFSDSARKEFDLWDGGFALVDPETPPEAAPEVGNIAALFEKAFKNRLEAEGVQVAGTGTESLPVLEVTLKKFFLTLEGRTWVSDLVYEAELSQDGSKTGRERIHAQAERTKIMGRSGGEKLIGEIFTDGINRLNLQILFENAGF